MKLTVPHPVAPCHGRCVGLFRRIWYCARPSGHLRSGDRPDVPGRARPVDPPHVSHALWLPALRARPVVAAAPSPASTSTLKARIGRLRVLHRPHVV